MIFLELRFLEIILNKLFGDELKIDSGEAYSDFAKDELDLLRR